MGQTGMQRLKDKHAGKKANVVKLSSKLLKEIDAIHETAAKTPRKAAPAPNPAPKSAKITQFNGIECLSDEERCYFSEVWAKLEELYGDDAQRYRLTAINLAKLYALGKQAERAIEENGGLIIVKPDGGISPNPAARILQTAQAQILNHLRNLGMVAKPPSGAKQGDAPAEISEFAQFQ